jgi:hypothetical protein
VQSGLVHYGFLKGNLSLEYTGLVHPADVLHYHPELKARLDEILEQGWTYLFIETRARSVSNLDIEDRTYKLTADGRGYYVVIELGETPPEVNGMPEVTELRINICTKSFPRAATIDLTKDAVTYVHEAFWQWQEEWRGDPIKLAKATEVYEVARWLLDVKKMIPHEELKMERFRELSKLFAVPREEPVK